MLAILFKNRFFNLAIGAGLGQGCMLITAAVLVASQVPLAGELTTAIGISSLLLLFIDWGGQVWQRQHSTDKKNKINLTNFAAARIPAVFLLIFILVASAHTRQATNSFIHDFLLYSLPGLAFSILNFSGYLDINSKASLHGLFANINHIMVSTYTILCVAFNIKLDPSTAGSINSAGIITSTALLLLLTKMAGQNGYYAPNYQSIKYFWQQGLIITIGQLPGQVISKAISIMLLQNSGSSTAAQYNLLKSASGIFTQIVTLARRAYYNKIHNHLTSMKDPYLFSIKVHSRILLLGSLSSAACMVLVMVLQEKLKIPYQAIEVLFLQNILWLGSSSYFYQQQILGINSPQSIHALSTCGIIIPVALLANINTAATAILYEAAISTLVFLLFILAKKIHKNKNIYKHTNQQLQENA